MKLVVDTSVLIDHLRGGKILQQILDQLSEDDELFISSIVFFELFSGKSSAKKLVAAKIYNLVKNFQKIELDDDIARRAGELNRDVTAKLEVPDYIIAASALNIGAAVLTLNQKHFRQIPHLPLYPFPAFQRD